MYPRKTATHRACEQASMYGLPISRSSGKVARYTRKWKATKSWWNPPPKEKTNK